MERMLGTRPQAVEDIVAETRMRGCCMYKATKTKGQKIANVEAGRWQPIRQAVAHHH